MISGLLSVPLLGILFILLLTPTKPHFGRQQKTVSFISFMTAAYTFFYSFIFLKEIYKIDSFYGPEPEVIEWLNHYVSPLAFRMDGLSSVFVLLTTFIILLVVISLCFNTKVLSHQFYKGYFISVLLIEFLLLGAFTVDDILFFYIFFESVLIPMYFIIGIWGSGFRKIKAGYYFFLFTLIGSLFMLLSIILLTMATGHTSLQIYLFYSIPTEIQHLLWLFFFLAFSVKIPLFPFHIWLPEAHVEAPTEGSVILAALLLKLGGYGFIRFTLQLLPDASIYFSPFIYTLSILGVTYASFTAVRQTDMKRIIAYASVAHMNFAVLGIFAMNSDALSGAIFLMIGHGIVSSALFFLVGVLYKIYGTRLIHYYGGLAHVMPIFSAFFLFFSFANIGLPGTSNFVGELLIFLGVGSWSPVAAICCSFGFILSVAYSIWLYNRICFGSLRTLYVISFKDIAPSDIAILIPLTLVTLLLGICPSLLLDTFSRSSTFLILKQVDLHFRLCNIGPL